MTAQAAPMVGRLHGYVHYYVTAMRIAVATQIQYRVANSFFLIGFIAEPVIYLVVWSTIARQQGGQVGGLTPSQLFQPELGPRPIDIAVFAVAIWGAYLVRTLTYAVLGMVSFWTMRVGPVISLVMTVELLLSGRLVPLSLMPDWSQHLADALPFKWTFGFPIEGLVGRLPAPELLGGLAMQAVWIAIGSIGLCMAWPFAVRRYAAVGG